ncbi:hypothetical protein [Martelella limonii]|uniref:hypothetical protein n=1 Tax=Martelella limonii TaxID=1647649 RepID=UPI001FCEA734|nr:hypothetical protein [Martelella limonii]
MKTGPDRKPLSERLKEVLAQHQAEAGAASTGSPSKSCKTDCEAVLSDWRAIIASDLAAVVEDNAQQMYLIRRETERELSRLRMMKRPVLLTANTISAAVIAASAVIAAIAAGIILTKAQSVTLSHADLPNNTAVPETHLSWSGAIPTDCRIGFEGKACLPVVEAG